MSIFIVKGREDNFEKSLVKSVDLETIKSAEINKDIIKELEKYKKPIFCWAWKTKKSSGVEQHKKYREEMKIEDLMLFVRTGRKTESKYAQTIMYSGKVLCFDENKKLAHMVWGKKYADEFDFIIFLKDIKKVNKKIYLDKFMDEIRNKNSKFFCANAYRLGDLEEKNMYKKFGDIFEIELKEYVVDKKKEAEEKNIIIKGLENFLGVSLDLQINNIKYSNLGKQVKNKKTSKRVGQVNTTKESYINEYNKKLIGYLGEEKVFYMLLSKDKKIYDLLNINSNYRQLIWFNENQDIRSSHYLDQSVGHGCDMYIELDNKKIFLEIKSSYENMNLLNFTQNEINTMKKCTKGNNSYYIIIVDRMKNLMKNKSPRLTIVNNFSDEISEEYIAFSNSHTIYANRLVQKHVLLH